MSSGREGLAEMIEASVTGTIENMAFVEVLAAQPAAEESAPGEQLMAAQLIHEPYQGEVWLCMSLPLVQELTENVYALSAEEITDAMLEDVVAELLNTITGEVVKKVLPDDCSFKLGLPEMGEDSFLSTGPPTVLCAFEVDGRPFTVSAFLDAFFQGSD
ncbi:chemotaxis protein CheX [Thermodesulfobacteriota bacterium]